MTAFTDALHTLRTHFGQSLLALIGVVVALLVSLSVLYLVQYEYSYDTHHTDSENVFRLYMGTSRSSIGIHRYATLPGPVATEIYRRHKDEGLTPARLYQPTNPLIAHGDVKHYESRLFLTDATFFRVFDVSFRQGSEDAPFPRNDAVVITAETAERYFGNNDPMGKTLTFEGQVPLTVTGVVEAWPANSHFKFDVLVNMAMRRDVFEVTGVNTNWITSWRWNPYSTYVRLSEDWTEERFETAVLDTLAAEFREPENFAMAAHPVSDTRLFPTRLSNEIEPPGSRALVGTALGGAGAALIFGLLQLVIMLVTTAKGRQDPSDDDSQSGSVFGTHLVTSIVICVVAAGAALLLQPIGIGILGDIVGQPLTLVTPNTVFPVLGTVAILAVLAAGIGALAQRHAARVGQIGTGLQALVVFIIFTVGGGMSLQMNYVAEKDLGFRHDAILSIPVRGNDALQASQADFREALIEKETIAAAALSSAVPAMGNHISSGYRAEGGIGNSSTVMYFVGDGFAKTLDLEFIAGRDIDDADLASDLEAYAINSTLATDLQDTPEETIQTQFAVRGFGVVEGVFEAFHFESLYEEKLPMIFQKDADAAKFMLVRIADGVSREKAIGDIEGIWSGYSPDRPLSPIFVADEMDRHYDNDRRVVRLVTLLGLVLGTLFFLSGCGRVMQVNGRRGMSTLLLVVVPILAAGTGAVLIGAVILHFWMERFAYHVSVPVAVVGVVAALFIGVATILYRRADPYKSASDAVPAS